MSLLRRFLDFQLSLVEKKKSFQFLRPFVSALDSFCYQVPLNTTRGPFIRDAVDAKRWMVIVIFALLPTILIAIWNTGLQKMVYSSGNYLLMNQYLSASTSLKGYFNFAFTEGRWITIFSLGATTFFPIMLISYAVGGLCEGIVAAIRKHEIAEGFLVTGMLYPLILPPTIPYWMAALGIAFGVLIGKELFGGTGMNILNPALTARAFLFFTFPGKMTGDVWAGSNPTKVIDSLSKMNANAGLSEIDGYTQATALQNFNVATDQVKRIHVDAIAAHSIGAKADNYQTVVSHFDKWNELGQYHTTIDQMSSEQLRMFVTDPLEQGGLALHPGNFAAAHNFSEVNYGMGRFSDGNLFWGNILGSMGETSTFACLLGAILLVCTGIGAWRTMVSFGLMAFLTAFCFEFFSTHFGPENGVWNIARYAMPAYKHLLMGGLAFGLVYMATDPVSSPSMNLSKWIYGGLIGLTTVIIRVINPAYPEGVMLAILFGNVFAPLIDYLSIRWFRRAYRGVRVPA